MHNRKLPTRQIPAQNRIGGHASGRSPDEGKSASNGPRHSQHHTNNHYCIGANAPTASKLVMQFLEVSLRMTYAFLESASGWAQFLKNTLPFTVHS